MPLFKKKSGSQAQETVDEELPGVKKEGSSGLLTAEPEKSKGKTRNRKKRKDRACFFIEENSVLSKIAVVLMAFAVFCRLVGSISRFGDKMYLYTQVILPAASALLFTLSVRLLGKKALWTSVFGVLAGVIFFVFRIEDMSPSLPWYQPILCIALYVLIFILWTGTVTGLIKTKWLLITAFALPFLYHVFVEDRIRLQTSVVSFEEGMQELSVLMIMLAMLLTALAMKKAGIGEGTDLPPIKAPVITGCAGSKTAGQEKETAATEAAGPAEAAENAPEEQNDENIKNIDNPETEA